MGQSQNPKTGFFLVEEESFTPPEESIIDHYRQSSPIPFMAKDMDEREQYLGNYAGQLTFLWFWNTTCQLCILEIDVLNRLNNEFAGAFALISLADDTRPTIASFLESHPVNFSIIPNAGILGEGAYAHDLGYPRLFVIGKNGLIQTILPGSYFQGEHDLYVLLRSIIERKD
ncbi:MAG: TlpA family protein disulfide reductase [Saprospiraceae bacterium]|nr:TlpA family protein disulfide reductase [Saprospiraceae bacterium]